MEKQLTQQEALQVLVGAANAGQAKGAYTLHDAELISKSIKVFTVQPQVEPLEEVKTDEE